MIAPRYWFLLAALSLLPGVCIAAEGYHETAIETLLQAPETPAKHMALAEQYRKNVAHQREMVQYHQRLEKRYSAMGLANSAAQAEHCKSLVALHERIAAEYEALAASEEAEAKGTR